MFSYRINQVPYAHLGRPAQDSIPFFKGNPCTSTYLRDLFHHTPDRFLWPRHSFFGLFGKNGVDSRFCFPVELGHGAAFFGNRF